MNCLGCGADVPAGVKFCYSCGRLADASQRSGDSSKILIQCANCGTANQSTYNVCVKCGQSLHQARYAYARILTENPASVKKLCIECGADNPKGATHCGNCGKPLLSHFPSASDVYSFEQASVEQVSAEQIDTISRIMLYIMSLLLPLGGFIVGAILYIRSSDPNSNYREVGKLCILLAGIITIVSILAALILGGVVWSLNLSGF